MMISGAASKALASLITPARPRSVMKTAFAPNAGSTASPAVRAAFAVQGIFAAMTTVVNPADTVDIRFARMAHVKGCGRKSTGFARIPLKLTRKP